MRLAEKSSLAVAAMILVFAAGAARSQSDASRAIAGGGISVAGWTGKVDANAEKAGQTVNDAKFSQEGNAMHVTTGPAVTYWNQANKATGNYTVNYRVTSADGHVVSGSWSFRLTTAGTGTPGPAADTSDTESGDLPVWPFVVGAVVLVAAAAIWAARKGR